MHNELANLLEEHKKESQVEFDRITALEAQIEVLKQMSAPKDDEGPGILDALNNVSDNLRKEFDGKTNGFLLMLDKLEDQFMANKKHLAKEMDELKVTQKEFNENAIYAY